MFQGHRVVACVPSGRYRYMRVGLPYLLSSSVVDEVQLWVNTDVQSDLDYFARMEAQHSKVTRAFAQGELSKSLYDASRDHWQFNDSIYRFYAACTDARTLYVKVDDDICYVHPDFFDHLLRDTLAREATNYACVGNVYNVPHVMKVLQDRQTVDDRFGRSTGDPRCPFACTDGPFAAHAHRQFLEMIAVNDVKCCYFSGHPLVGRQRIGVMSWTGRSFQQFGGQVGPRDEVELTTRIPEALGRPLWMVGDAVACHFAFSHQRATLEDTTDTLRQYLDVSVKLNGDLAA